MHVGDIDQGQIRDGIDIFKMNLGLGVLGDGLIINDRPDKPFFCRDVRGEIITDPFIREGKF